MSGAGRTSLIISMDFSGGLVRFGWDAMQESPSSERKVGYHFLNTKIFQEPSAVYHYSSNSSDIWEMGSAAKEEYQLHCDNKNDNERKSVYYDNIVASLKLITPTNKDSCAPTWPFSYLSASTILVGNNNQNKKEITLQQLLVQYFSFVQNTLYTDIRATSSTYSSLLSKPITWVILISRELSNVAQDLLYNSFQTLGIERKHLFFMTSPYAALSLCGAIYGQSLFSVPYNFMASKNIQKFVMVVELNTVYTEFSLFEALGLDVDGHIRWKSSPLPTSSLKEPSTSRFSSIFSSSPTSAFHANNNLSELNGNRTAIGGVTSLVNGLLLWLQNLTAKFQNVVSSFPQAFNQKIALENIWTDSCTRYYEQLLTDKLQSFLASLSSVSYKRKHFHISLLMLLPNLVQREYFSQYINRVFSQGNRSQYCQFQTFSGELYLDIHHFLIPTFVEPLYLEQIYHVLQQFSSIICDNSRNHQLTSVVFAGDFAANSYVQKWFSKKDSKRFHPWFSSKSNNMVTRYINKSPNDYHSSTSTESYNRHDHSKFSSEHDSFSPAVECDKPNMFNYIHGDNDFIKIDLPANCMALLGGLLIMCRLLSSHSIPPLSTANMSSSSTILNQTHLGSNNTIRNSINTLPNSNNNTTILRPPLFAEAKEATLDSHFDRKNDLKHLNNIKASKDLSYFSHKHSLSPNERSHSTLSEDNRNTSFSSEKTVVPVRKTSFSLPPVSSPLKYETVHVDPGTNDTWTDRTKTANFNNDADNIVIHGNNDHNHHNKMNHNTNLDNNTHMDVSGPHNFSHHPHLHLHPPNYRFHYRADSLFHPQQQESKNICDANDVIDPLEERFVHHIISSDALSSGHEDNSDTANNSIMDNNNIYNNKEFIRSIDGWQLDTSAFENIHSSVSVETIFSSPSVSPPPPPPPLSSPPLSPNAFSLPSLNKDAVLEDFHPSNTNIQNNTDANNEDTKINVSTNVSSHSLETIPLTTSHVDTSNLPMDDTDAHSNRSQLEQSISSFLRPKSILRASFYVPPSKSTLQSQFSFRNSKKKDENNNDNIDITNSLINNKWKEQDANLNLTHYNTIINAEIGKPFHGTASSSSFLASSSTSSLTTSTEYHASVHNYFNIEDNNHSCNITNTADNKINLESSFTLKKKKSTRFSFIRQPLPPSLQGIIDTNNSNNNNNNYGNVEQSSKNLSVTSSFWSFHDNRFDRSSPVSKSSVKKNEILESCLQEEEEEEEEEDIRSFDDDCDLK